VDGRQSCWSVEDIGLQYALNLHTCTQLKDIRGPNEQSIGRRQVGSRASERRPANVEQCMFSTFANAGRRFAGEVSGGVWEMLDRKGIFALPLAVAVVKSAREVGGQPAMSQCQVQPECETKPVIRCLQESLEKCQDEEKCRTGRV
jgi:hypothetical protein